MISTSEGLMRKLEEKGKFRNRTAIRVKSVNDFILGQRGRLEYLGIGKQLNLEAP